MSASEQVGVRCGERFSTYPSCSDGPCAPRSGLQELGVGAETASRCCRNSLEFLESSIATVPLGASAVPINWHWRGEEIAHVLRDSRAKVLLAHADLWPAVADSVPEEVSVVLVPGADGDRERAPAEVRWWPNWLEGNEPWAQAPERGPVSIIYTSGTTGRPKGVMITRQRTPASRRSLIGEISAAGASAR